MIKWTIGNGHQQIFWSWEIWFNELGNILSTAGQSLVTATRGLSFSGLPFPSHKALNITSRWHPVRNDVKTCFVQHRSDQTFVDFSLQRKLKQAQLEECSCCELLQSVLVVSWAEPAWSPRGGSGWVKKLLSFQVLEVTVLLSVTWNVDFLTLWRDSQLDTIYYELILVDTKLTPCCFQVALEPSRSRWWVVPALAALTRFVKLMGPFKNPIGNLNLPLTNFKSSEVGYYSVLASQLPRLATAGRRPPRAGSPY